MVTLRDFDNLVIECLKKADEMFAGGVPTFSTARRHYDLTGRVAGQANRVGGKFVLYFNKDCMRKDWRQMTQEVIPHEVAHLVQFHEGFEYKGGKRLVHGARFKEICLALGGTGERCHTIEVTRRKKPKMIRRFIYVNNFGREVRFSTKTHNRILQLFALQPRIPLRDGSSICRSDFKKEVILRE